MKENSFWDWLISNITKEGYKEPHIQGIFNGKDSLLKVEEFKKATSIYIDDESNKQHIYPSYLRIYMYDGGLFEYDWRQDYDGEEVYERHIRFIPPFKKVYVLNGYSENILPIVHAWHNSSIPDNLQ